MVMAIAHCRYRVVMRLIVSQNQGCIKKGNQLAIPLTESLPKISFLPTKDSVLATNQLDTEDTQSRSELCTSPVLLNGLNQPVS